MAVISNGTDHTHSLSSTELIHHLFLAISVPDHRPQTSIQDDVSAIGVLPLSTKTYRRTHTWAGKEARRKGKKLGERKREIAASF